MKKKIITLLTAVALALSMSITSWAGEWKWQDIDGNNVSECYYYDDEFYNSCDEEFKRAMHFWDAYNVNETIRTTPDGYQINAARQWIVDGVVQTQKVETEKIVINNQIPYEPEHPLSRVIDAWDLRLPTKYVGEFTVASNNIQAMLTGQMDQYYMPPVGYSTSELGNQVYTSQEAYDRTITQEKVLYDWFCNWLNGMNFETMSEMDRAKEIQKVLGKGENVVLSGDEIGSRDKYSEYSVLIDKNGNCTEYAIVATSLAKALGLKSAMSGTGTHAVYYIQVDGKAYFGQNNVLNLNIPTPDFVAFD